MSSDSNKKSFWYYVNSKWQDISGISTLTFPDCTIVSKPSEKAEFLSNLFEDLSYIPDKGTSHAYPFQK